MIMTAVAIAVEFFVFKVAGVRLGSVAGGVAGWGSIAFREVPLGTLGV